MEVQENAVRLYSTDSYMTEPGDHVYRVASGTVLVYVAPLKNGRPERRLLLCRAETGKVIPNFCYQDQNYTQWRFLLVAEDEAELTRMEGAATSVLFRKFARYAGLQSFEQEGFEQSVVEFYTRESLKDNVFINRGKKDTGSVESASFGVIRDAFGEKETQTGEEPPLYRVFAVLCRGASIPFASYERIQNMCGSDLTPPAIAQAAGLACRKVVLDADWYRSDSGYLIGTLDDQPVALIPRGQEHYTIYYGETGKKERLVKATAEKILPNAWSISRTLPNRALRVRDLLRFGLQSLRTADLVWMALLSLAGSLIGVLLPTLNQTIYDEYIPMGDYDQLVQVCLIIAAFMFGNLFFSMIKGICEYRISSHVGYDLQNAFYHRVFRLPQSFFRSLESTDLSQRLLMVQNIAETFLSAVLFTGIAVLCSIPYLVKMFRYSAQLSGISLLMLLCYALLLLLLSSLMIRFTSRIEENRAIANSRLFQFLNGVEKIRMAGVEDRAAHQYLLPFAARQTMELRESRVSGISESLAGSVSYLFSMVFFFIIVHNKLKLSSGAFMGFSAAFTMFSTGAMQLVSSAMQLYLTKPQYDRIRPLVETAPEDMGELELVQELKGAVSIEDLRFSYGKDAPEILRGISLDIRPGEYVGIVGASGSGKSTLLKLLLGFEQPVAGAIRFDGRDLKMLDKRSLRKNLGVVLQNGKLIAGSIYENITITAPWATMREVDAVIDAVGLTDDIAQMPMGIHTVLSENAGTISGGQQQRILIARAIISRPSILIFDEATSALDNLTQAAVCENLDKMQVTRIVVAHRLSTIRNCDRIFLLDQGRIAEEGSYEQLMARRGLFYQMAERQITD